MTGLQAPTRENRREHASGNSHFSLGMDGVPRVSFSGCYRPDGHQRPGDRASQGMTTSPVFFWPVKVVEASLFT